MKLQASCLLLACSALVACGSSSKHDATSGGATPQARALPEGCAAAVSPSGGLLVDDFEDNDELLSEAANLHGLWYVENDGSGEQSPPAGAARPVGSLLDAPGSPSSPRHALHTSGGGFQEWGAFVGVKLNASRFEGCAYDVSGYSGLELAVRGSGSVRLNLGTVSTTPRGDHGECESDACSDYGASLELADEWTEERVAFHALKQPDWATPADFDAGRALRLSFWAEADSFDFWIDEVRFYE